MHTVVKDLLSREESDLVCRALISHRSYVAQQERAARARLAHDSYRAGAADDVQLYAAELAAAQALLARITRWKENQVAEFRVFDPDSAA